MGEPVVGVFEGVNNVVVGEVEPVGPAIQISRHYVLAWFLQDERPRTRPRVSGEGCALVELRDTQRDGTARVREPSSVGGEKVSRVARTPAQERGVALIFHHRHLKHGLSRVDLHRVWGVSGATSGRRK